METKEKILLIVTFVLLSAIFIFAIGLTSAVQIETENYKIWCEPETATITSQGYVQTCEYLNKGTTNLTLDTAFCFGSTLDRGKVIYYNTNGKKIDITPLFQYKYYNMTKGYCYYIPNIDFIINKSEKIDILYIPTDLKANKWDTYFGDIDTDSVLLKLDPYSNSSQYKMGYNTSYTYYWGATLDNGTNDCNINNNNITSRNATYYYYDSEYRNYTLCQGGCMFFNSSVAYIKEINMTFADDSALWSTQIYWTYMDGSSNTTISGWNTTSGGILLKFPNPNPTRMVNNVYIIGVTNTAGDIFHTQHVRAHNIAEAKTVCSFNSTSINSTTYITNFTVNMSYQNEVDFNVTFDGITYINLNKTNLSNSSKKYIWSSALTPANDLRYRIRLRDNNSTVSYFKIDFVDTTTSAYATYNFTAITNVTLSTEDITKYILSYTNVNNISADLGYFGANFVYLKWGANQTYVIDNTRSVNELNKTFLVLDEASTDYANIQVKKYNTPLPDATVTLYYINDNQWMIYSGMRTDAGGNIRVPIINNRLTLIHVTSSETATKQQETTLTADQTYVVITEPEQADNLTLITSTTCRPIELQSTKCYFGFTMFRLGDTVQLTYEFQDQNITGSSHVMTGADMYQSIPYKEYQYSEQSILLNSTNTPLKVRYYVDGQLFDTKIIQITNPFPATNETNNGTIAFTLPGINTNKNYIIINVIILIVLLIIMATFENKIPMIGYLIGTIITIVIGWKYILIWMYVGIPIALYILYMKFKNWVQGNG